MIVAPAGADGGTAALAPMKQPDSAERGARVRVPPPLLSVASTLLGVALGYLAAPAPLPGARAISVIGGLVILVAGMSLALSARTHFTRTGQNPMPWTPSPELILQGPYRFTRNPMYVGLTLAQVGIGLAVNNLWIAALAIASLAAIHFTAVLPEERYLGEKFGESYEAYRRRVRRYL